MGVYGCLWESMGDLQKSMDKSEYEGVYDCYGSLFLSIGVYGCLREYGAYGNLQINMNMWVSIGIYGCLWKSMDK